MLSNGTEAKVGTLGSKYEFFHEWKRLAEEDQGSVALETMLRGICKKENFLDLFENFILYDHSGGHTAKILARNHQYLGVNEAMKAYAARKLNDGKLGVFWHTQGSGKSYSMVFLAQKVRRKFEGSPTFVILTDREELNSQISDTFENCGLLGKTKASQFIATSGDDLVQKLKGNPSFIFTLIQKFNKPNAEPIYPDHDIIIMSDEAHRSQYGIFADNMMKLLPTAARIGFTGTPLLSSDSEETVFYVSKLLASVEMTGHDCPIIMDSFRAEDLSTEKEKRVLDLFGELRNQCILTTTLKAEEKGKYDTLEGIHVMDYTNHRTNKILGQEHLEAFKRLLRELHISV